MCHGCVYRLAAISRSHPFVPEWVPTFHPATSTMLAHGEAPCICLPVSGVGNCPLAVSDGIVEYQRNASLTWASDVNRFLSVSSSAPGGPTLPFPGCTNSVIGMNTGHDTLAMGKLASYVTSKPSLTSHRLSGSASLSLEDKKSGIISQPH